MTKSKKTISSFVNNQFDFILFLIIIILLSLGIVMVLSASAPSAIAESGNSYSYVKTQLLAAVIGIGLMIGISKIDYRIYKNFYKIFYVSNFIMMQRDRFVNKKESSMESYMRDS